MVREGVSQPAPTPQMGNLCLFLKVVRMGCMVAALKMG